MAFTQVSYEDIYDQSNSLNVPDELSDNSEQDDNEKLPNLNPDFSLGSQEFEKVVYYKNPKVHSFVVIACGLPLIWLLFSAFSPVKNPAKESAPVDTEKEEMAEQIEQLVKMNQNLTKELAMADQAGEIEVTDFKPEPVVKEEPKPVEQPAAPKPVIAEVVKPEPVVKPKPKPEIDPMDQWLSASSSGHYLTSAAGSSDVALESQNQETNQQAQLPGLFADQELAKRLKTKIPEGDLNTRIALAENVKQSIERRQQEISKTEKTPKDLLETGSSVSATLERGIYWGATGNSSTDISKGNYLLTLDEGWENDSGEEVLPEGTKVIAKINTADRSGILNMEVVRIKGEEGSVKVPTNTISIDGEEGSTLQAKLKRENNSSFGSDLSTIAASGVEESFDDLGTASSNIIIGDNEGDTVVTTGTNSSDNPLASGVSGLADGIGDVLETRLQAQQSSPNSSYFELKRGTTVELTINRDFEI